MKQTTRIWTSIISAFAMIILILDAQTALKAAKEGITICLYTIIPSLFPFLFFSCIINSYTTGHSIRILRPLGKICGIPAGSESLLLLGLIGGYPVGAQGIYQAYKSKAINTHDAKRLLGFCSNAGPAFIFGMMSGMFSNKSTVLIIWAIHIASALIVGAIIPGKSKNNYSQVTNHPLSFTSAMEISIKTMAGICGWIIIFRILMSFLKRWILWILPASVQVLIFGLLELSNGCISLYHIYPEGLRFILSSIILSIGGICVYMQTKSVTKELGTGSYFPGKILQSIISVSLSLIIQQWLFPPEDIIKLAAFFHLAMVIGFSVIMTIFYRKNNSRNLAVNGV